MRITVTQISFFLLLSLFQFACVQKNYIIPNYLTGSSCHLSQPAVPYDYSRSSLVPVEYNERLGGYFARESIQLANSFGFMEALNKLVNIVTDGGDLSETEKKITALQIQTELQHNISIASFEISAIASELDCEEERAEQVANYIQSLEDKRETHLTVAAIVVGATGAALTAVLLGKGNNQAEMVGVFIGLSEAVIGLSILTNKRRVKYTHPRNALRDLWTGIPESQIFTPPVWLHLNTPRMIEDKQTTLRQHLIENWNTFGQLNEPAKAKGSGERIDLYFGAGGNYTAEQLVNRANMYDQTESFINLIHQDLKTLSIEIRRLVSKM